LSVGEAALLPGAEEAGGELKRFRLARRLTGHIRHRQKYLAAEVAPHLVFQFTRGGEPSGRVARSLQDLLAALGSEPDEFFADHLTRGDFSNWIDHVLADRVLASEVRKIEQAWRDGAAPAVRDRLARTIRARYSSERVSASA